MTDIAEILPHKPPMLLLDDIVEIDLNKKYVKTSFKVTDKNIFFDKSVNGIPSICGIEFMAQTIGCYAYFANGEKEPKIGFLLGSRLFNNLTEVFELGDVFTVTAEEIYFDEGISAFGCSIFDKFGREIASASINVFQNGKNTELPR